MLKQKIIINFININKKIIGFGFLYYQQISKDFTCDVIEPFNLTEKVLFMSYYQQFKYHKF